MQPKGRMVVKKPRKSKTDREKLADALERASKKLGTVRASSIRAKWESLSTGRGGKDRLVGDGLMISMLQAQLSYIEIQALFNCGKGRICRIKNPGAYAREEKGDSSM